MVDKKIIENSLIYKERIDDSKFLVDFFDIKQKKVLSNIDTFYYTVDTNADWNLSKRVSKLVSYFEKMRDTLDSTFDDFVVLDVLDSELIMKRVTFACYKFAMEVANKFIIFFAKTIPNTKTPPIVVQIRSEFLWLRGERLATIESFEAVSKILKNFDIEPTIVKTNRIDFAYHTNLIRNMTTFFKEDDLNRMQVSRFKRYGSQGRFVGDWLVEKDYLCFGRRTSNNFFVRIYDKTQEVVNQGYKQFFLKLWLSNGLINRYDYYCLEKCFLNGNFNYLPKARLEFYLEYGSNDEYLNRINEFLFSNKKIEYDLLLRLANYLTPSVTTVCNIEFQTKRKFYSEISGTLNILKCFSTKYGILNKEVFKILDNRQIIHEYLTNDVLRFIDYKKIKTYHLRKRDVPTSSWWKKIQSVKIEFKQPDGTIKLQREYQTKLDINRKKIQILNSLSTLSLYKNGNNNNDLLLDSLDFVNSLNESDVHKAFIYKNKKLHLLGDRVVSDNSYSTINKNFELINSKTGEVLKN